MAIGTTVGSMVAVVVFSPLLVLTALILLPIAFFTTILAASTLSLRASLIYMELFIAVVRNQLRPSYKSQQLSNSATTTVDVTNTASSTHLPRTRSVSSSSGSRTPKFEPANIPPTPMTRDFEGVGGWREGEDEGEGQWLTMNSRLELPAISSVAPEQRHRKKRHHHRHSTTSSLLQPGMRRQALSTRPSSVVISGTTSPLGQAGLNVDGATRVKSMFHLGDAGIRDREKAKAKRRKSSSSSSSSGKTLMSSAQT